MVVLPGLEILRPSPPLTVYRSSASKTQRRERINAMIEILMVNVAAPATGEWQHKMRRAQRAAPKKIPRSVHANAYQ